MLKKQSTQGLWYIMWRAHMFQTSKHLPKNLPTRGAPFMSQHCWVWIIWQSRKSSVYSILLSNFIDYICLLGTKDTYFPSDTIEKRYLNLLTKELFGIRARCWSMKEFFAFSHDILLQKIHSTGSKDAKFLHHCKTNFLA